MDAPTYSVLFFIMVVYILFFHCFWLPFFLSWLRESSKAAWLSLPGPFDREVQDTHGGV